GVLTRHQPAVASELLSTGETLHSPNLGPNHHCQDIFHSRQTLKQVCFSAWSESLHHLRFDHFKILIDMIELPEHPSNCLFSIGGSLTRIPSTIARPFLPKASLASSTTNPYFAKVACTRFLSCVLCRLNTMRVRGSSRASRTDEGGIQTVGNVPVLCSRFIPLASSLSLLFTLPIISFASRALTSCGFPPPSSISSTLLQLFSLCILYPCPGVLLVNIQCDVFHNCSPPRSLIVTTAVTEYLAFILIRMTPARYITLYPSSVILSDSEGSRLGCGRLD